LIIKNILIVIAWKYFSEPFQVEHEVGNQNIWVIEALSFSLRKRLNLTDPDCP
jgi:hypothetical protein